MDFKYRYNADNGICIPFNAHIASNRSDLIPLTNEELELLKRMSVGEIVARRAVRMDVEASVAIETDKIAPAEETPQAVVSAPIAKGVAVVGKIEKKPDVADGDSVVDYTKYFGRNAPIFQVEELAGVPDCDLVRFAAESMHRTYQEPSPELLDTKALADAYAAIRLQIARNLKKDAEMKMKFAARKAEVK